MENIMFIINLVLLIISFLHIILLITLITKINKMKKEQKDFSSLIGNIIKDGEKFNEFKDGIINLNISDSIKEDEFNEIIKKDDDEFDKIFNELLKTERSKC